MRWAKHYNNDSGCGSDDDDHVDDHDDHTAAADNDANDFQPE